MDHTHSHHKDGVRHTWDVKMFWEIAKGLDSISWVIPESFLEGWNWGQDHISEHVDRCLSADLSYPILIHQDIVLDGTHRLIKAIALNSKVIPAIVLEDLPPPLTIGVSEPEESSEGIAWTNEDMVKVVRAFLAYEERKKYAFRHPIDGI